MADTEIECPVSTVPEKDVIEVGRSGAGCWTARVRGTLPEVQGMTRKEAIILASTEVRVGGEPLGRKALFDPQWASQFFTVKGIKPPRRR